MNLPGLFLPPLFLLYHELDVKFFSLHIRKNEVLALGQAGTRFTAPMRGLGVMRRGQQRGRASTRARDHFRERAQNTSRPPSMHVDDFVKMAENPGTDEIAPPPPPDRVSPLLSWSLQARYICTYCKHYKL